MESDEKSSFSLIAEIESKSFEDSDTSYVIEDEHSDLDLSLHESTIDIGPDDDSLNTECQVENDEISDVGVSDELMMKDVSFPLSITRGNKKNSIGHNYCSVNKVNKCNESFVSCNTVNSSFISRTCSESLIDENLSFKKIEYKDNVSHEFNNRIKITKVESFNNNCLNENKMQNKNGIVYKINKIKSLESGQNSCKCCAGITQTISDLFSNLQVFKQQTSLRINQLENTVNEFAAKNQTMEERISELENLLLRRFTPDPAELEISDCLDIPAPQKNKDEENLKEGDNEISNCCEYQELTNMSCTDNIQSTDDNLTVLDDEESIYQHEKSCNVIIGHNENEENMVENNLLLAENTFYEHEEVITTTSANGSDIEKITEDNLVMMEDNENIYQFEEWLDDSCSGSAKEESFSLMGTDDGLPSTSMNQIDSISDQNKNISSPSSYERIEDLPIDKSLSKNFTNENSLLTNISHDSVSTHGFIPFIPYFSSTLNNTNDLRENRRIEEININNKLVHSETSLNTFMKTVNPNNVTETTTLERPACTKKLSIVLDRNEVWNYLKKRNKKQKKQFLKKHKIEDNDSRLKERVAVYNCARYKSKFTNSKLFNAHTKTDTKKECYCKLSNVNDRLSSLLRPPEKRSFNCNHCDYESSQSKILNRHIRKSGDQYLFRCELCSFVTEYASNLKLHKFAHIKDPL